MELLQAKGAQISYVDPHVPCFLRKRKDGFNLAPVLDTLANLAASDFVLFTTD